MKITPQISANGLVEYCYATAVRRTTIIENAIRPKNFLLDTRYNDIERAVMDFIESRGKDDTRLLALDRAMLERAAQTSHEEQRLLTAHDAIELCRTLDLSKLPAGAVTCLPDKQPKYELEGTMVGVRPSNMVTVAQLGKRERAIGLVKPYICKTRPLSMETASLQGTLLLMYAREAYRSFGEPRSELCSIIDVFAQRMFSAPRNHLQRTKMLKAACREIADRWPIIRARLIDTEVKEGRSTY